MAQSMSLYGLQQQEYRPSKHSSKHLTDLQNRYTCWHETPPFKTMKHHHIGCKNRILIMFHHIDPAPFDILWSHHFSSAVEVRASLLSSTPPRLLRWVKIVKTLNLNTDARYWVCIVIVVGRPSTNGFWMVLVYFLLPGCLWKVSLFKYAPRSALDPYPFVRGM